MDDEDEENSFKATFEDGHWTWDDAEGLVFVSDVISEELPNFEFIPIKAIAGLNEFRDDINLFEQLRFRRRYQRKLKVGQPDIITLQDVKDLALYTARASFLSPTLINMLHTPTAERFIRSLILYSHYYLQVADDMDRRMKQLESKIRTPECEKLEGIYRENLCDIRALVAKEYSLMITGTRDMNKFHHMGPHRKQKSLTDKEARLFESLLRISIQIVWIALGRRSFNILEVEINRIFKTEIFNSAEHRLLTGYLAKLSRTERSVLLGGCVRRKNQKLNTRSPIMDEITCARYVDHRLLGLGVIKYSDLSLRLQYLYMAVAGPEEDLRTEGVWVGILGLPRSMFDTMLHILPSVESQDNSKGASGSTVASAAGFKKSNRKIPSKTFSVSKSSVQASSTKSIGKSSSRIIYAYEDIRLPPKESRDYDQPATFPETHEKPRPCNEEQRERWQERLLVKLLQVRQRQCESKANATSTWNISFINPKRR